MERVRIFRIGTHDREPKMRSRMLFRILIPFAAICFLILLTSISCNKKQPELTADSGQSQTEEKPEESIEETPETPEEAEVDETTTAIKTQHVVMEGECLWIISGYEAVYSDPYRWEDIYEANRNQITDPDLIYPEQRLTIPR